MQKILIIEDEAPAAKRLQKLIKEVKSDVSIVDTIDSVEHAVNWLNSFEHPDIIFMDIQLADGLSLAIFDKVTIQSSVIFTTAFDHYAIKAFRLNGLDYLLKPIDVQELKEAIQKHEVKVARKIDYNGLEKALSAVNKNYKERILIKLGDKFLHLLTTQIAYFFAEDGVTFVVSKDGAKHIVDHTLEGLYESLNPKDFFRINRKVILHIQSLKQSISYFNSRLKLDLFPAPSFDVIVSREKVNEFKMWLDQ